MFSDLRNKLAISPDQLEAINTILLNPDSRVINDFLAVVAEYGTPQEINQLAHDASQLPALLKKVEETKPEYLEDLPWLEAQRNQAAFISVADYRRKGNGG